MTWRGHRPTSVPWPRGVPLRSTSSRSVAATGVAAIPLTRFSPPRPPVKGDDSGRRLRVCPARDRRIFERSAAPMGFPCTYETLLAPHGAFIRRTPARLPACTALVSPPDLPSWSPHQSNEAGRYRNIYRLSIGIRTEFFSSFDHSTCALSVPCRVFRLARNTPRVSNCSLKQFYS
jgi:hypothetical protein